MSREHYSATTGRSMRVPLVDASVYAEGPSNERQNGYDEDRGAVGSRGAFHTDTRTVGAFRPRRSAYRATRPARYDAAGCGRSSSLAQERTGDGTSVAEVAHDVPGATRAMPPSSLSGIGQQCRYLIGERGDARIARPVGTATASLTCQCLHDSPRARNP